VRARLRADMTGRFTANALANAVMGRMPM
jgi:hypothetical protein